LILIQEDLNINMARPFANVALVLAFLPQSEYFKELLAYTIETSPK